MTFQSFVILLGMAVNLYLLYRVSYWRKRFFAAENRHEKVVCDVLVYLRGRGCPPDEFVKELRKELDYRF